MNVLEGMSPHTVRCGCTLRLLFCIWLRNILVAIGSSSKLMSTPILRRGVLLRWYLYWLMNSPSVGLLQLVTSLSVGRICSPSPLEVCPHAGVVSSSSASASPASGNLELKMNA